MRRRLRLLPWWLALLPLGVVLALGLRPPSDESAIRELVERTVAAYAAGDTAAVWQAHDLDWRQVCQRAAVNAAVAGADRAIALVSTEPPRRRSVRAAAAVTVRDGRGTTTERWQFVRDAGRWYLLGDADTCLPPSLAPPP